MFFNYRLYQDDFLVAMLNLACFCLDLSNHIKSYMTWKRSHICLSFFAQKRIYFWPREIYLHTHDCYDLRHRVQRDDPCFNKAQRFSNFFFKSCVCIKKQIYIGNKKTSRELGGKISNKISWQLWSSSKCLKCAFLNRKHPEEKNVKLVNMPQFVT